MPRKKKNLPLLRNVKIESFAAEGKTVTRVKLREEDESPIVLFVPYAVPGDVCDIQVTRKKHSYAEGRIERIVNPSPMRVKPRCRHFGSCGGCKWQQMDYAAQARGKQEQVEQVLRRIGKVELPKISPIIAADCCWEYRNKMEYTFSNKRWWPEARGPRIAEPGNITDPAPDNNALGFHVGGAFDKVLQIEQCLLQDDLGNRIRNFIYDYALEHGLSFYDIRNNHGLLRNIMIRITGESGSRGPRISEPRNNTDLSVAQREIMLIVVFGEDPAILSPNASPQGSEANEAEGSMIDAARKSAPPGIPQEKGARLLEAVDKRFPEITSLGYVVNLKLNDSIADQEVIIYKGKDHIIETMEGLKFRINPKSFYQTNSRQACRLYSVVKDFAFSPKSADCRASENTESAVSPIVYDLYTGAGTIANFVADKAAKVVGIEYVEEAIADARINSELNGIKNTVFYAGDMKNVLTAEFIRANGKPDIMIIDPPRAGMHQDVVNVILEATPKVLVYVSCNPATQARDLELLSEKYAVTDVQPVDMFPHTHHVENVVRLERRF